MARRVRTREFLQARPRRLAVRGRLNGAWGLTAAFTAQPAVLIAAVGYDPAHPCPDQGVLGGHGQVIAPFWLPEGMGSNEASMFTGDDRTTNADRYRDEFSRGGGLERRSRNDSDADGDGRPAPPRPRNRRRPDA